MQLLRSSGMIVSWMTVLPLRIDAHVDRESAGRAISCLPAAGLVVGAFAAALAYLLDLAGAAPLLSAALVVAGLALFTRGMHLDGTADIVDALASYTPPEEARAIMKEGSVGPLGAGALALVALVEVAAYAQLIDAGAFVTVAAVGVISRTLPIALCRRSMPGAGEGGFGPLVARTQGFVPMTSGALISLAAASAAGWNIVVAPARPGLTSAGAGEIAIGIGISAVIWVTAFVFTEVLGRHVVRRLGGISGDVLGAAIAIGGALVAAGFAILAG